MKFRKKPVVIEAMQYTEDSRQAVVNWLGEHQRGYGNPTLSIITLEGEMRVDFGDYVICGVKGEFYPCRADIFAATYDPVE